MKVVTCPQLVPDQRTMNNPDVPKEPKPQPGVGSSALLGRIERIEWTVEEMADGEFQIWTPDICGACIGEGANRKTAIANAISALVLTIEDMRRELA